MLGSQTAGRVVDWEVSLGLVFRRVEAASEGASHAWQFRLKCRKVRAPSVQVRVSTRHGHLSDASQAKIASKAEKLLRIFDRLTEIEVVVDLSDEHRPRVDVQVSAEHKHDFVGHDQNAELMVAVDSALDKVEHQLRKYKERVVERHRDRDREVREVESPSPADNE